MLGVEDAGYEEEDVDEGCEDYEGGCDVGEDVGSGFSEEGWWQGGELFGGGQRHEARFLTQVLNGATCTVLLGIWFPIVIFGK